MKNKMLKQMVTVLISFLIVFISIPVVTAGLIPTAVDIAKALLPTSFTATEGTDTNLLNYFNAINGMSATGVTLSLESDNANVAADGTITYTGSTVTGNVIVKINKTDLAEASKTIAVTVPAHTTPAGFFAGKYGKAQIFNGWGSSVNLSTYTVTGMRPTANEQFSFTNLTNIYDANLWVSGGVNSGTATYIDWGVNNDRYVQFVDSATAQSTQCPSAYTVKLNLYEADGTLVKTISNYGTVWGLSQVGFLYVACDSPDFFISNSNGYPYMVNYTGPSISYIPTSGIVTNVADLNSYAANTTVLGVGETAAGKAAIETAKGLLPTNFTATEGTDTNLLDYLNAISGMSATGVTLSLESDNASVATDGTISYTSSAVTGNVIVKINKTGAAEANQTIAITVPAHMTPAERANADIAAAQALLPATFTATEGTTTNLLIYLNALTGMSETGTILTIESDNANIAPDGTISYTSSIVTGNVTVKINKTGGTEASQNIAVTVPAHTVELSGDYILIVNESLTDTQESGTIFFNDSNPFGASDALQSMSVNENVYQQNSIDAQESGATDFNDTISGGSSDLYQQPIDAAADFDRKSLSLNTQSVTYTIGDTKTLGTSTYTLRGIGEHCYIWMDDTTYNRYDGTTLAAAIADIISVYDTTSYPVLQTLGADTLMNYRDGSGKLSIFLEKVTVTASGYFSLIDFNTGITGIHIPLSTGVTQFWNYGALLAHEGQHALNASTQGFNTWINEGLSIAAMDMYYNGQDVLNWLNNCVQNRDAKSGIGLAHIGYTNNSAVDYSVPFLFLRYLNAQANQGFDPDSNFYSKLYVAASSGNGLAKDAYIIEQVLEQYESFKNQDGTYWTFNQAVTNFRIAAFKQEDTGIYGFYGDSVVKNKINGPGLYFGQTGKSIKIEPTGGIIVKTNNNSFAIPSDAGSNMKFVPFNDTGSLPTMQNNKMYIGGKIDTTIYQNEPITFNDIRVVIKDSNGNFSKIYKNLSELYADGYSLLALRNYGSANQSNYVLDSIPNDTIKDGDYLYIRQGTGVINSSSDWGDLYAPIGSAIVKSIRVTLQSIAITNPATKLTYTVGDELDITGLVVTGTYSDGSFKAESITDANITGFSSAVAAAEQVLTVTVEDKTCNYTVQISAPEVDECFIATAAFGSKFQPAVVLLRHFRDQYLLTNSLGTAFVKFYYRHSPPIANYIAGNEGLEGITRILLIPFIAIVYLIYNPLVAVLLLILLAAVVLIKRRRLDAIS
ncbi:MAG: bacterial Ig-like domain-containing protein [Syntrophomonadaceae bacterium]|nr:bacterial Ig-like domain-containing protein [Syntrophomonadaceae bacterium]